MIKNNFSKFETRQDGITLVISIVLLAAVTFISFSLSTLIIREIVAARLLLKSEPALSAANSGGEVGLYRLQRGMGNLTVSNGTLSQSPATYDLDSDVYDDPYLLTSAFLICGAPGEFQIPLYDATNWGNKEADYGSVEIVNTGGCPIKARVFSWSDAATDLCSQTIPSGNNFVCSSMSAPFGDDRYVLSIRALGNSGQTLGATITAKRNDGTTSRGVPSENPTLQITGKSGEVQRKIQIQIKP